MSNWLFNFFLKKHKSKDNISSEHFTYRIMKELQALHTPLTISFKQTAGHNTEQCVSMVVNVDFEKKHIFLDECSTKLAHSLAVSGERFRVETSESGISVIFHAIVLNVGKREGIYFYQIDFPDHLEYQQKREAFRARSTALSNIQIYFKNSEGMPIQTKMIDLSPTGMGLIAAGNIKHLLKASDQIERCTFSPMEDTTLTCKFEVRRVHYNAMKQVTNIGCRFIQLSQNEQRTINKVVSLLQQEARKRENRLDP